MEILLINFKSNYLKLNGFLFYFTQAFSNLANFATPVIASSPSISANLRLFSVSLHDLYLAKHILLNSFIFSDGNSAFSASVFCLNHSKNVNSGFPFFSFFSIEVSIDSFVFVSFVDCVSDGGGVLYPNAIRDFSNSRSHNGNSILYDPTRGRGIRSLTLTIKKVSETPFVCSGPFQIGNQQPDLCRYNFIIPRES
uniref:CSON003923 protein n=1 Tax=Culicoides sonorensis TaxID=179676 RepID=A0A336M519_CULSO